MLIHGAHSMTERAQLHITEMGQTGAGIDHEEDIQPGTALKTKWGESLSENPLNPMADSIHRLDKGGLPLVLPHALLDW